MRHPHWLQQAAFFRRREMWLNTFGCGKGVLTSNIELVLFLWSMRSLYCIMYVNNKRVNEGTEESWFFLLFFLIFHTNIGSKLSWLLPILLRLPSPSSSQQFALFSKQFHFYFYIYMYILYNTKHASMCLSESLLICLIWSPAASTSWKQHNSFSLWWKKSPSPILLLMDVSAGSFWLLWVLQHKYWCSLNLDS